MKLEFKNYLKDYTAYIDKIAGNKIKFYIFIASALSLYFELMIIRLHSSFFQIFAYYKNLSLLSCFLGLGIGFALNPKKKLLTPFIMPLFLIQILPLYILRFSRYKDLFQNPVKEQFAMGLVNVKNLNAFIIVILFIIIVFAINVLCFIPVGQLVSKFMSRIKKLNAYSWNLLGSMFGIILFSFLSYLCTPPILWIIIGASALLVFLYKKVSYSVPTIVSLLILIISFQFPISIDKKDIYSPYQILTLTFRKNLYPEIKVNNVYFQHIIDFSKNRKSEEFEHYLLPYFLSPHRMMF